MKNRLREIIIHYLKFSKNYLYFTDDVAVAYNFTEKNFNIYSHAKSSIDTLRPSSLYTIKKLEDEKNSSKNKIDVYIMKSRNAKSFKSHDFKLIMDMQRESIKYSFSKYTKENTFLNRKILENVITLLVLEISNKIEINDSSLIHYFKDKNTDRNITNDELYEFAVEIIQNKNANEIEVLYNYAQKFKFKKFKEEGIFIKANLVHDIYDSKFSLFEVNKFAFIKGIEELKNNKKSANDMFDKEYIKIDNYIDRTSNDYQNNICYFNPFILENKKFINGYLTLVDKFEREEKAEAMQYNFLQVLSNIQYIVTCLQQDNLQFDIMLNKKTFFPSFIKESIENYKKYADLRDIDKIETLIYLEYFDKYLEKNKLINYKNISIEDIGCGGFNRASKIKAEKILNRILTGMLKTKEYTLLKMHKTFSILLIEKLRESGINIDMKDKTFIEEIIMYLIFEDLNSHKLDNKIYYNDKFKYSYDYYVKTNIHTQLVANNLQDI